MSLKTITHKGKKYKKNKIINSYLHHVEDDKYLLLVYTERENIWVGVTEIEEISNAVKENKVDGYDCMFEEHMINYEYYVDGIEYLHYRQIDIDEADNSIVFDLKKYLKKYETDIYKKLKKTCKDYKSASWRNK